MKSRARLGVWWRRPGSLSLCRAQTQRDPVMATIAFSSTQGPWLSVGIFFFLLKKSFGLECFRQCAVRVDPTSPLDPEHLYSRLATDAPSGCRTQRGERLEDGERALGRPADFCFLPGPALFPALWALGIYVPAFLDKFPCLLASPSSVLAPCQLPRPGRPLPSPSLAACVWSLLQWEWVVVTKEDCPGHPQASCLGACLEFQIVIGRWLQ